MESILRFYAQSTCKSVNLVLDSQTVKDNYSVIEHVKCRIFFYGDVHFLLRYTLSALPNLWDHGRRCKFALGDNGKKLLPLKIALIRITPMLPLFD